MNQIRDLPSVLTLAWEAIVGSPPGVRRRLVHTWPWPHWLTIAILIAGTALIVFLYVRERAPRRVRTIACLLRCLVLWIVVLALGYGWQLVTDLTDLPDLLVVVDDSSSMTHEDVGPPDSKKSKAGPAISRFEWTRHVLSDLGEGWLGKFRDRYRLKVFRVAADLRPVPADADRIEEDPSRWVIEPAEPRYGASRLGNGLRAVLDGQRGRPTAAVILLTDGITTEGKSLSEVANHARRLDIPLYVVGVGNERPAVDARISDVLADDTVFVGDVVHFDVRISGSGLKGRSVTTRLRWKDERVLAEVTRTIVDETAPINARLSFRPEEVGEFDAVIEVDAGGEDVNPGNNRVERHLSVRDEVIRVLYVQQYPSFDFRYLKTLLERGLQRGTESGRKSIELAVVLQEADAEYPAIDASALRAFPVDREALFRYDVVLFGDVDGAFFTHSLLDNLADFVKDRGGGLVFLCGPRHTPWAYRGTPLDELMPIDTQSVARPSDESSRTGGIRAVPSSLSQDNPVLQLLDDLDAPPPWTGFPDLNWVASAKKLKPAARVLAEAHGPNGEVDPLVVLQFIGAGKVIMLMSDEFHRLARHADGDLYYARFWLQVLRYLSRGKLIGKSRAAELTIDQESYAVGDRVMVMIRFLDDRQAPAAEDGTTVELAQRGGRRRTLKLERDPLRRGLFRTSIGDLTEGDYRLWMVTPTLEGPPPSARFLIIARRGEAARMEMDLAELLETAKVSRGRYYTTESAHRLLDDIPEGRQVRIQSLPPQPIWNSPIWPIVIAVLLSAEWILRKKGGML